jgi:peroxiredoxin
MAIAVNSSAPDFELKDQNGTAVRLSSLKGKKVLLSFRPLAWTPVCRDQMKAIDIHHQRLEDLNTIALGIGVDSAPSNKAWSESMAVTQTKLLADFWPHGEVAMRYGVFRQAEGFAERANIIVDEHQKVTFVKVYPIQERPDIEEIIRFLKG